MSDIFSVISKATLPVATLGFATLLFINNKDMAAFVILITGSIWWCVDADIKWMNFKIKKRMGWE